MDRVIPSLRLPFVRGFERSFPLSAQSFRSQRLRLRESAMPACFRVVPPPRSPIRLSLKPSAQETGHSLRELRVVAFFQHNTAVAFDERSFSTSENDRDSESKFRKKLADQGKKFQGRWDALSDDWIKRPCCQRYVVKGPRRACCDRIPLAWFSHVVKYPSDRTFWDYWPSMSPRNPASKGALPRCLN